MKTISKNKIGTILPGRSAFTLIELLVVISIIGVLATFTVVGLKSVTTSRKISTAKAEMRELELAIENYHAKYGIYPPGNGLNTVSAGTNNQLYYELSGVTVNASGNFQTLDSSAIIVPTDFNNAFNIPGILNTTKGGGEDAAPAKGFLPGLKANRIGTALYNGVAVTNLVTSVGGPDEQYQPVGVRGVNPFRYKAPSPTNNNPDSYDLWIQLSIGSSFSSVNNFSKPQKYLICNWNKSVLRNTTLP